MSYSTAILAALLLSFTIVLTGCSPEQSVSNEPANTEVSKTSENKGCPIVSSRAWAAWINKIPGPNGPTLNVNGEIDLPSPGYSVSVTPGPLDRKRPPNQRLILALTPPAGLVSQLITSYQVSYKAASSVDEYEGIIIVCGQNEVVTIDNIESAH